MELDFSLRVSGDRLIIRGGNEYYEDIPHSVVFNPGERKILDIGKTIEDIDETVYEKFSHIKKLEFIPCFDIESFSPEICSFLIFEYSARAYKKTGKRFGYLGFKFFNKCVFNFSIPNYEKLSKEVRDKFEYLLVRDHKTIEIRINGKEIRWKRKEYAFVRGFYNSSILAIPYLMIYSAKLFLSFYIPFIAFLFENLGLSKDFAIDIAPLILMFLHLSLGFILATFLTILLAKNVMPSDLNQFYLLEIQDFKFLIKLFYKDFEKKPNAGKNSK